MKTSKKLSKVRLVLRHISGSKANQIDEFPIDQFKHVTFGRSANNDMAYDPEIDDVVSREHGKITVDSTDPLRISIHDLGSRNGIYVNGKKIEGSAELYPGDIVQLGKNGPEFEFDVNPPQKDYMKKTRVVEAVADDAAAKPTRVSEAVVEPESEPVAEKRGVGKETVERIVMQSQKKTRKIWLSAIAAGIIILLGLGYIFWPETPVVKAPELPEKFQKLTPTEIAQANSDKVVYIEAGWKMTYTVTGEDVYHLYLKDGKESRGVFLQMPDGSIEPWLVKSTDKTKTPESKLIGGLHTGSGFVVSEDGFLLTNRHVAAAWMTGYSFPKEAFPGILYRIENGKLVKTNEKVGAADVFGWVPFNAKFFGRELISGKTLEGKNMYLDVTFNGNDLRIPATIARISNKHDVAMIKINLPESLPKVTLKDRHNEVKPGEEVVVMGYPAISPSEFIYQKSEDVFNRNPHWVKVPTVTVTNGNISKIINGSKFANSNKYFSTFGDVYQLTINAAGGGNSGGPLFDAHGNVIGIYFAGKWDYSGTAISFAVPIKYGIELMGTKKVL